MTLPHTSDAVVDIRTRRDYCLSLAHPRGKLKARVFESALDEYGTRYQIDATLSGPARAARVRSIWIVRSAEAFLGW